MAGKSKKGAMRLLSLKGQVWWFKRDIPASCRPSLGVTAWLRSLETSDVRVAKERRDELEIETAKLFANIRSGRPVAGLAHSAADRGNLWREAIRELSKDAAELALARHAEEAEKETLRASDRQAFTDARLGRVPVDQYLDAYLSAATLAPKSSNERRGLVKRFAAWCANEKLTLDKINRKTAGRYVTAAIDPMHPVTASAHLLALRQYWIYLHARGHIADGDPKGAPWTDQQLKNNSRRIERGGKAEERPFTANEVNAFLNGPYPERLDLSHRQQMVDAIQISLLSGMRMDEVLTLWVEEAQGGVFDIQQGKTEAAARKVPIHPALAELVERRTQGKGPKDWLFHELKSERDPGDTFGKRFRRYRLKVGVDDKREGKRRSLVNFHSARRWFITQARYAGQPKETIGNVVGHVPDKKDITFGVYTPGASEEQWRACVESVQLPPSGTEGIAPPAPPVEPSLGSV